MQNPQVYTAALHDTPLGNGTSAKTSPAQLKADIEETIRRLVAAQIEVFREGTGLDVSAVNLQFESFTNIGTRHAHPRLTAARIYI